MAATHEAIIAGGFGVDAIPVMHYGTILGKIIRKQLPLPFLGILICVVTQTVLSETSTPTFKRSFAC